MNESSNVERLGGLLLRIGNFNPKSFLGNFKSRLILQKTIYLMQVFALNIGYQFNWYLRGPYSPDLARDAYRLAKSDTPPQLVRFVDSDAEKRFLEFQQFVEKNKSNPAWLEKIASIHFLRTVFHISEQDVLYKRVKEKVPSLSHREFETMYALLESHNLIS